MIFIINNIRDYSRSRTHARVCVSCGGASRLVLGVDVNVIHRQRFSADGGPFFCPGHFLHGVAVMTGG